MKSNSPLHTVLLALSVAMLVLLGVAWMYPVHLWGLNFISYAPLIYLLAVLPIAVALAWPGWSKFKFPSNQIPRWVWSLVAAVGMWAMFFFYYIDTELYGDALLNIKVLSDGGDWAKRYHVISGSTFNIFTPKNGEQFTFSIVKGLSRLTGLSMWATFRGYASVLGAVWVFIWMQFVQRKIQNKGIQMLAALLGIFSGMTMTFYAMPEVYAPPLLFFTGYLICLVEFLETGKKKWLVLLFPLLLMAIRTHSSGFALAPSLVYALLVAAVGEKENLQKWTSWRRAGWMIPAVFLAIGLAGYLTVFKAGDDSVKVIPTAGNMFLTPFGGSNPDDAYYLFGFWHAWDFVQELLFCSAAGCVIFLAFLLAPGRKVYWTGKPMVGLGIATVMLLALYFAIDPHVTLPRDWDLFSLVFPPILVTCIVLIAQAEEKLAESWLRQSLLLLLIGLQFSFFLVNHDKKRVHDRQLDVAQHVFASNEPGGAFLIKHTLDAYPTSPQERVAMLEKQLKVLAPYENAVTNTDFAFIYQYGGILCFEMKDFQKARNFYLEADKRLPEQVGTYEDLAVVEFNLGSYDRALYFANLAMRFQSKHSANWVLAFTAARRIGNEPLALQIGIDYLQKYGDPNGIRPEIEALAGKLNVQPGNSQ
ncbi:MAG: hypothetical protein KAY96_00275 [Bacteroidia bacterium]|nr:hypothetical protein [Bacteroidia bacterium]